jgi:glycosyltransferase involved in cell wall biosynthesis
MEISVVVPCLNSEDTLPRQLKALSSQRWAGTWEVVIADNGSSDGSVHVAQGFHSQLPRLRIVDASDRRGAAHALNIGARAAAGDVLLFCDADDLVGSGWLKAMAGALRVHDFVACRLDYHRLALLPPGSHRQESGLNVYAYPQYLPHAGGGSIGIRKVLHFAVGGFDESMKELYDTDYCFRVQLAGTPLHFVPDAVVYAQPPVNLRVLFRKAWANGEWNVLLYKRYRARRMPPLRTKEGLAGWWGLVRGIRALARAEDRPQWVWQLGWRLGRIKGCLKHRVLAL